MAVPVRLPELEHWRGQVKCQAACPVSTDAGQYVQCVAEARDRDAFLVARAPNPLVSVCGRICAAPCEDACRRGSIDAPVSIRAIKRFVTERHGVESRMPSTQDELFGADSLPDGNLFAGHLPYSQAQAVPRNGRVAVIGSGPAGIAAAHDLALLGYQVTIYEAGDEPGGMMRFGIPEYRLPRSLIRAEIERVLRLGVRLELKTPLTSSFGLPQLKDAGFDAIFLAIGVSRGRDLQAPGVELDGVIKAVDYLLNINRGYRVDLGENVVVIGGGFVAFDAARTALRGGPGASDDGNADGADESDSRVKAALDSARAAIRGGARHVTIISLEDFNEMPVLRTTQGHEEFEEATKEGIEFVTRRGPRRFLGTSRLEAVELRSVLSVFDADGRFAPRYDDESLQTIAADSCILAIGQQADLSFVRPEDGIDLTPGGLVRIDRQTLATSAPGIFAGGDVAFGPRNLIEAVANGKRAARSIHEYLSRTTATTTTTLEIEKIPTSRYRTIAGFELLDREAPPTLDLGRRTGIAEVETAYTEDEARRQAARCLVCHVQTIYDPERCVLCGRCVDVCPEACLALVPFEELALDPADRAALEQRTEPAGLPLSAMVKDDERCIRCGLCAVRCPTDAMTMERFTIVERARAGVPELEGA